MLSIRPATRNDAPLLRTLIRELAEYERQLDQVEVTEADLLRDGFGAHQEFRALNQSQDVLCSRCFHFNSVR